MAMILYHVSPTRNTVSISEHGIDPSYSTGKLEASWYVSKNRVLWAIAHCSARHDEPVNELTVHVVEVPAGCKIRRTSLDGVMWLTDTMQVIKSSPAAWFLDPDGFDGDGELYE